MIEIKGKNIEIVRGNYLPLTVTAKNTDGTDYLFQPGDVLRFKVFERKNVENVFLEKDFTVNEISKEERKRLVNLLKALPITITGTRGWNEAIITRGGVSVKEINPSTMECKNHPGIYFIGEVLDLDAKTGGFNLQIAWSTAYLAGISV